MDVGVLYPGFELGGNPDAIRRFGLEAERLNFHHLLMYDHVLGAVQEDRDPPLPLSNSALDENIPYEDALTLFAYLAGITKKIKFITGVIILPQRQVALVARQAADVSRLSGGRLTLGVGSGWNHVEYQALGVDFAARGKILDEQIEILRKLWTEDVVSFDGQHHKLDRVSAKAQPESPIPIFLGGYSKPAYRRAARVGDGFIFPSPIENGLEKLADYREIAAQQGRSEEGFGIHYFMNPAWVQDPDRGPMPGFRNAQMIIDDLERWRDAGGTGASISTAGIGFTSIDQHLELIQEVAERLKL